MRGKSYRGGRWSAAVLVFVCLVAASCQSGTSSSARESTRASQTDSAGTNRMWCKTQPDAAWKNVLKSGLVSLSRHTSIVPIALSNDGRSFFAEIYTKTYSGVVRIDASNSRYTEIKRFPDPVNDQASGNFDGRWLVWAEFHSLYDQGDFTVWSWDSRTGRLGKIGSATRSPSGKFWPGSSQ